MAEGDQAANATIENARGPLVIPTVTIPPLGRIVTAPCLHTIRHDVRGSLHSYRVYAEEGLPSWTSHFLDNTPGVRVRKFVLVKDKNPESWPIKEVKVVVIRGGIEQHN